MKMPKTIEDLMPAVVAAKEVLDNAVLAVEHAIDSYDTQNDDEINLLGEVEEKIYELNDTCSSFDAELKEFKELFSADE